MQVEVLQQRCAASDTHTAQLQDQLSTFQADQALAGGRLHDGSLDHIKGRLILDLQQQLVTASAAAAAATTASQQSAAQLQSLEQQLLSQQQAQAGERERLSMEAAQSRLLCKARARQVSTLEAQSAAQVSTAALAVSCHVARASTSQLCIGPGQDKSMYQNTAHSGLTKLSRTL